MVKEIYIDLGQDVSDADKSKKEWDLTIDGILYKIDPDKRDESEVSKLVFQVLGGLRSERKKQTNSIYFDGQGLRRKKSEVNNIRKNKEIVIRALDCHIDILQGKAGGSINFIKSSLQGSDEIVGLKITYNNCGVNREVKRVARKNILPIKAKETVRT